jgi:hypothetical protein
MTLKTKLSGSSKPDIKAVGDTLKIFKVDTPPSQQGVSYMIVVDPVVKTQTYNPVKLMYDNTDLFTADEAKQLYDKLSTTYNGINPLPLNRVTSAAGTAPAAPAAPAPPAPPTPQQ